MDSSMNFGFTPAPWDRKHESFVHDAPFLLEGGDIVETVCPVSKLTGHRTNPLTLLNAVTDGNSRLLQALLAELPAVQEIDASDEDKMDMIVSRLDTGTFADLDKVRDALSDVADVLFAKSPETPSDGSKPTIEFSPEDVIPAPDAK